MVSARKHKSSYIVHSQQGQPNSRLGIQTPSRLQQLDVESMYVSVINEQNNHLHSRSVCRLNKCPAGKLHELVPGSGSGSSKCISPIMGTPSRVCLSLIQSDISLLAENQVRESNTSLGDPSMVSPTVVCNIVRNVNTEPSPSTNKSPSSSVTQRRDSSPPNEALVTTSRVGCLRKSLHTMALSKQTEELLLNRGAKAHIMETG